MRIRCCDVSVRACLALIGLVGILGMSAFAQDAAMPKPDPTVIVFYEEGCPNCLAIDELLAALTPELQTASIRRYEITDPESFALLTSLADAYEVEVDTVPAVFIGDVAVVGAGWSAELAISDAVTDCARNGCPSPLERLRRPPFPWADVLRLAALAAVALLLILLQPL